MVEHRLCYRYQLLSTAVARSSQLVRPGLTSEHYVINDKFFNADMAFVSCCVLV